MTRLKKALELVKSFYHALRYRLWVLKGYETTTGEPLSVAFAGSEPMKNYWANLLFEQHSATSYYLGPVWVWNLHRPIQREPFDCSMLVCEVPHVKQKFFKHKMNLRVPVWVGTTLHLKNNEQANFHKKKYSEIRRRIRKYGLSATFFNDEQAFDEFYHKMYVPLAVKRHDDAVVIQSYSELKRDFFKNNSEIMFVEKEGHRIAGNLIDYSMGDAHLVHMGVRDGSDEIWKMGIASIIYYFCFMRGAEKNMEVANLGFCRAFLKDGVLQAKKELGGFLTNKHHKEGGFLNIQFLKHNRALLAFLENNPMITMATPDRFFVTVFSRDESPSNEENVLALREEYCLDYCFNTRIYPLEPLPYEPKPSCSMSLLSAQVQRV